jgi:hypothetical protein
VSPISNRTRDRLAAKPKFMVLWFEESPLGVFSLNVSLVVVQGYFEQYLVLLGPMPR